jgi:hypothetical protein
MVDMKKKTAISATAETFAMPAATPRQSRR